MNPNPDDQHQFFLNRVDMQDREMKDGNVSIILKNVTGADNGTYECRVFMEKTQSWEHMSSISLRVVDPPGQTGGHTEDGSVGLKIGLSVSAVLLVAAVVGGFLIYRKQKQRSQDSGRLPAETKVEMSKSFQNSESPAAEHRDPEANNCHQHSTRIPDVTLTLDELLQPRPPQQTAGLHPESESIGLLMSSISSLMQSKGFSVLEQIHEDRNL
ncbi:uncharacterized protein LOC112843837 [Oreochromis niloticus]|uniref:uncharacterized protein LOC112843837 n=1 Tax=Oreochromis niloticus TaxID=8128 RepID=UPI000DF1E908|nr:uncharacterized protein LOC112843837 [Oreochromis niloticus]